MKAQMTWMAQGVIVALAVGAAQAVTFTWVPVSGTNDWNTPANWTPAGPPGVSNIADTATLPAAAVGVINYNATGPTFSGLNV